MRKIKFRGKTTANGHWVYGSLIDYGDNTFSIRNNKSNPWVQPSTVGQFTGLLDRNGKEIYEGDIVEAWSQGQKNIGEVKQRNDGLWLIYPAWLNGIPFCFAPDKNGQDDVVVIGNIHEQSKS